jgi:hypothetical protein
LDFILLAPAEMNLSGSAHKMKAELASNPAVRVLGTLTITSSRSGTAPYVRSSTELLRRCHYPCETSEIQSRVGVAPLDICNLGINMPGASSEGIINRPVSGTGK